jgi:hypothetical protein
MTVRFIYEPDYPRLIPAIMIEARAGTPLANKTGAVIKQFTDSAVAAVTPETIVYRIENAVLGVIAGYMTVEVGNMGQTAVLSGVTLRPAYQSSAEDISQQISNFMAENGWKPDYLI